MGTATFIDILLAILLPPLGVFLKFGCEVEFWICLVLTLLGWIPGILYALWVLVRTSHSSRKGNTYVRNRAVDDGVITAWTTSLICLNVLLVCSFILFLSVVVITLL